MPALERSDLSSKPQDVPKATGNAVLAGAATQKTLKNPVYSGDANGAVMDRTSADGKLRKETKSHDVSQEVAIAIEATEAAFAKPERKSLSQSPTAAGAQFINWHSAPVSHLKTKEAELQHDSFTDVDMVTFGDNKSPTGNATTALSQAMAKPELPSLIGRQMMEVLQRLPDKPVELTLNPRELGRVRMSIAVAEAGITVSVLTERPETLDLMRRNIDQLASEFQHLGYKDINFAFSERRDSPASQQERTVDEAIAASEPDPLRSPPEHAVRIGATSGLDLRL